MDLGETRILLVEVVIGKNTNLCGVNLLENTNFICVVVIGENTNFTNNTNLRVVCIC